MSQIPYTTLRALYIRLDLVICTNRAVKTLVMFYQRLVDARHLAESHTIDNRFQRILDRFVYVQELRLAVCLAECTRIHQVQRNLYRNAVRGRHKVPFPLDRLEDIYSHASAYRTAL